MNRKIFFCLNLGRFIATLLLMNNWIHIIFFCVLNSLFANSYSKAQGTSDFGIQAGVTAYRGDINDVKYSKSVTTFAGLLGHLNLSNRLALRYQLLTGDLKAEGTYNDAYVAQTMKGKIVFPVDQSYNFNFNRSFESLEIMMEYNFHKYNLGLTRRNNFTPFVAVGLGIFYSKSPSGGTFILNPLIIVRPPIGPPNAYYYPLIDSRGKQTNGLPVITAILPISVGIKFNLTKRIGAIAELTVRRTFSDNIDNLTDPQRFRNPGADQTGYPAAQNSLMHNDYYASISFSLCYRLWNEDWNKYKKWHR